MNSVLKNIGFLIALLWCGASFSQSDSSIVFHEVSYDFGDLAQSDTVSHIFTFTNNTRNAVQIVDVITQCGCTSSVTSQNDFIEPGATGDLEITFDSEGKEGRERKTIKVKFSDFSSSKLVIYANVLVP